MIYVYININVYYMLGWKAREEQKENWSC